MGGLEVCAGSYASALAAQEGGAIRVELCAALAEGGTTPSYAQIALCKRNLSIPIYPIIRPRAGDFLYSDVEYDLMKEDIINCKSIGCDGVVFGILTDEGEIDQVRCAELIALASPMSVAFHRAFDMVKNHAEALEVLIALGFERVLTSGGAATAEQGISVLNQLVKQARGRISIMPGAGINLSNLQAILHSTKAIEFHTTAKNKKQSNMKYRGQAISMGNSDDAFTFEETSVETVKALTEIINKNSQK